MAVWLGWTGEGFCLMESWRATMGAMKSVNTGPLNPIRAFGCFYTHGTVGADDKTVDILKG